MRRKAGFTIIELLVVISIIGILAAILIPALVAARARSKHAASQATIQDFSVALKAYEADYGSYPQQLAASPLQFIRLSLPTDVGSVLAAKGAKGTPYYEFRTDQIIGGNWVSALNTPYKYRENASISPKPLPSPIGRMNIYTFDIWAKGYGDTGMSDTTSEPPGDSTNTFATLKNW